MYDILKDSFLGLTLDKPIVLMTYFLFNFHKVHTNSIFNNLYFTPTVIFLLQKMFT